MVAICPSCHDACHIRASLIDDATLYAWKQIQRPTGLIREHFYIEPAREMKVLMGSVTASTSSNDGLTAFKMSNSNQFGFKVLGNDIFLANCEVRNLDGKILVQILENYVTIERRKSIKVERRTGKISVRIVNSVQYLPEWLISMPLKEPLEFVSDNGLMAFEIEVVRPGVVRIQGAFVADDAVFVITQSKLLIYRPEINGAVSIIGSGETTIINGTITRAAFQL